ncbi:MAG: DUF4214 domain-containing protein, partial [Gammaproteobacteria bacterium]|nr:DUF4214 domain-containing protein [Gammaproteobacteria bacterium]
MRSGFGRLLRQRPHASIDTFLEEAYRTLLGRPLDEAGRSFYGDMLRAGRSRDSVLMLIAGDEEAINRGLARTFSIQSLRDLRPENYELVTDVHGRAVPVFRVVSRSDHDWLEQCMHEYGFFERPFLWSLGI